LQIHLVTEEKMHFIKYPISYVHLEITGECNFDCKFCYNSKYRNIQDFLTFDEIKDIINQLVDAGGSFFVISGGEPFMRKDIMEILYYLKSKKLPVRILTNGSLITEKIIEEIKKYNLVSEFRISLDSISNRDLNRGKHIEEVLKTIKTINNSGINLVINTVLTEQTYKDILDLYEFIKKLNVSQWRIDLPFYYGEYIKHYERLKIKDNELLFNYFSKLIKRYLKDKPPFGMDIVYVFRTKIIENGILEHDLSMHPCDYMKDSVTIRPNGDVSFCPTLPLIFGNIRNNTLQDILNGIRRTKFMKLSINQLKKCPECKYIHICGGGCRADAYFDKGDLKAEDKKFCDYMVLFEKYIIPEYPEEIQIKLKSLIKNDKKIEKSPDNP
jgi:radical SAM protein with 4Fe4S-binding SPASM domain